jgi:hypothetical protein
VQPGVVREEYNADFFLVGHLMNGSILKFPPRWDISDEWEYSEVPP